MNHCVPSFDIDEDYSIPSASLPNNKANLEDDGIVELLWQNGQVVMQRQKSVKKSATSDLNGDELNNSSRREIHNQSQQQQQYLFMQEDEMASWLHYPLNHAAFDNDFCSDLLYSPAPCVSATVIETEAPAASTETTTTTTATQTASAHHAAQLEEQSKAKVWPRPPIPPSRMADNSSYQSSLSKSRIAESVLSGSNRAANEFTVVDSDETPAVPPQSRVSKPAHLEMSARGTTVRAASLATSSSGAASEMILTSSSPDTSSASPNLKPPPPVPSKDRKRKVRELDDADFYDEITLNQDIELKSPDVKKHARGLTSAKRSRAAEVHNLSERRRRDRINEKMRALQELVPHCNKADKASMLDEAIEYLKSLQMQVQTMSMGCSMVPMMFPGVQQYMPPHPHKAAAMAMGMNCPMMPFPNTMLGGSLPIAGAGPHLGSRFPMLTPFHHMQQQFSGAEQSRIIPPNSNSANPVRGSSFVMQNPNQPTNFVKPYQQYLSRMQFQTQQQNQAVDQGSSKSGTSKGNEHPKRHPSG